MISIDFWSCVIGMVVMFIVLFLFDFLMTLRKKKHDLHSLKKIVYETGVHTKEAYKGIRELEGILKEIENAKG